MKKSGAYGNSSIYVFIETPFVHDLSWQSVLADTVALQQQGHGRGIYPRHEEEVQEQEKTTAYTPQEKDLTAMMAPRKLF